MKYFSSHATIYGGIHRYYFNTKCDFKSKTLSIIKCKTENEFLSDCWYIIEIQLDSDSFYNEFRKYYFATYLLNSKKKIEDIIKGT